jgi:hypothetical protein
MPTKDHGQTESTTDNNIPQLDGTVDDQVKIFNFNNNHPLTTIYFSR